VVFACTLHGRLLAHTCPACHSLVHQRAGGAVHGGGLTTMLPLPNHQALHPAACRHPAIGGKRRHTPLACGFRLGRSYVILDE
jgi:hypothetical protein